jgi:hypothetical protein
VNQRWRKKRESGGENRRVGWTFPSSATYIGHGKLKFELGSGANERSAIRKERLGFNFGAKIFGI